MRVSEIAIEKIKDFEGFRATAYKCPAGKLTIGYGHTSGVLTYQKCTREQAHMWLVDDMRAAEKCVGALGIDMTQGQFDALCDFVFNVGAANFHRSTLLKKIRAGAGEAEIRGEFSRWVFAAGKVLPGLITRRQWESDRYFEN